MGLQSFEHGVERMVEGVFSRSGKSSIRPIELGRRLVREMDDHRSVDVKGRRIVPNHFQFHISPRDHAGFADIEAALVTELGEAAREHAREEGYHFMGPVSVSLLVDEQAKAGRFGIVSAMREAQGGGGVGTLVMPSGERMALTGQVFTVGRLPESTISLNDANVSRRHAEFRSAGRNFVVADLGSTNGTKVNGTRIIGEHTLVDGDIVSFGGTHIRFEAS
ncbi:MAG: hypothetical protein JWN62_3247 [Acidimicrobiales bacterium]|nr:hypothetical protein [Acidimicrobiales bacterium]